MSLPPHIERHPIYDYVKLYLSSTFMDTLFAFFFSAKQTYQPQRGPLFIMGSGRNGSTLLACMLNNHSQVSIPAEHSFIPSLLKYWHTHPFHCWQSKTDKALSLLERTNFWNLDLKALKTTLQNAPKEHQYASFIIEAVYLQLGNKTHKASFVWGDKTPSNTHFIKLMNAHFSNCNILFLIRDPRDYIASLMNMKPVNRFMLQFYIWRWKHALKQYEYLNPLIGNRIKLLSYESLVNKPEQEIREVLQWLNLDMEMGVLKDYAKNMTLLHAQDKQHHQNILQPINTKSIQAWKKTLTTSQLQTIEQALKGPMQKYGYALSQA